MASGTITVPVENQWCGKSLAFNATFGATVGNEGDTLTVTSAWIYVDFNANGIPDKISIDDNLPIGVDTSSPYSATTNTYIFVPSGFTFPNTSAYNTSVSAWCTFFYNSVVSGNGLSITTPKKNVKIDNQIPTDLITLSLFTNGWIVHNQTLEWVESQCGDGTPNISPLPNTAGTTGSGIYGYNFKWDTSPSTTLAQVRLNANPPTCNIASLSSLVYLHTITANGSYNVGGRTWTTVKHFGPFYRCYNIAKLYNRNVSNVKKFMGVGALQIKSVNKIATG